MKLNHFYCVIFTNFCPIKWLFFFLQRWMSSFMLTTIFCWLDKPSQSHFHFHRIMSCNIKHIKYSPPLKDSHHSIFDAHKKDKSLFHSYSLRICVYYCHKSQKAFSHCYSDEKGRGRKTKKILFMTVSIVTPERCQK